jgi:hypothetical protein
MAINLDVQDLDNYPGTVKRVTLDMDSVVPTGTAGDEKNMLTASTSAYADVDTREAIQSLYIMGQQVGWTKSSGFEGLAGKFQLTSSNRRLGINMDATVSGTYSYDTKGYYEITLEYEATPITGTAIATDIQAKIRAITCNSSDIGYQLAYRNAAVTFDGSKFHISSGTISTSYTGSFRSSAIVAPAQTEDCTSILGFNQQLTSEALSAITAVEAQVTDDYTAGTTPLKVSLNSGISTGDCFYITDGVNQEYCTALGVSGGDITVPVSGTNDFDGITNNYTTDSGSFIQVLKRQDPENSPNSYCTSIDELTRYMATNLINQIDFSG